MSNYLNLDKDVMREQLNARNVMKQEMRLFYGILLVGGILSLFSFFKNIEIGFAFTFVFLVVFRTATVWYQWNFLIRFKLKCPYCNKPLAEKMNLMISPNHNCPHCGERALAPIKQLVEFEKEENK